ncbi:MAG: beta-lactamase family protein [Acidobacteria bacterium]|nr:beta-lactamase family protein [Acidobacteriota bacterium]
MRKVSVFIVTVLWLLGVSLAATAQNVSSIPQDKIRKIEAAISATMAKENIPGMSVAVVMDKKLVWANGYGFADLENKVAAKASTVYRLASISKTITSTAVLQLVERGKLDLDAPVQNYCPAFPPKQWPVTTRQVLGHLGGIRHYLAKDFPENTRHFNSINDSLSFFKDDPLIHQPGSKYFYSSYGYNLLGCVIEGASGMTYLNFVRDYVFKPALMMTIREDEVAAIIANRAQGYSKDKSGQLRNSELADTSYKIPGGGFCATVEDVAKFASALQTGKLLKPESLKQAWSKQRTSDGKATAYGLGWQLNERHGVKEISHGGNQARVTTYLYMLPERGLAVVLMMNLEGVGSRVELARQISDIVLP